MKDRRRQQIGSVIERAVREVLVRGINDPRVKGIITVTRVEVTPDLDSARVGVTVMPEEHEELTLHGLKSASKRIRRDVSDRVRLREMPALVFYADRELREQAELLRAIARATAEREADGPLDGATDNATDGSEDTETGGQPGGENATP